jgi:hypothetical protein
MSTLAVILIIAGALLVLLFVGGLLVTQRRREASAVDYGRRVAEADRALEEARAADRGWDRALLEAAAREALAAERPDLHPPERLDLVLVDDRPGVTEDRCHLVAGGGAGEVTIVLARRDGGWVVEQLSG